MAILDSVSYDQYDNIPNLNNCGINTKIIFSRDCYIKLLQLINESKSNNNETGCFFVGIRSKEDPFTIYIDSSTSSFDCVDGHISGGAVQPTELNYTELNNIISNLKKLEEKPVVVHYHTHPKKLHYESFSDQDLCVYAKMQLDNPTIVALGMLGFPSPIGNAYGLSIVQPLDPKTNGEITTAEFYMYQNIYYCDKTDIYKIGGFDKNYKGRKHPNSANNVNNIVRNAISSNSSSKIYGFGIDPNTKQKIEDEIVGYIDANNSLCFHYENLTFNFSRINKQQSHKQ